MAKFTKPWGPELGRKLWDIDICPPCRVIYFSKGAMRFPENLLLGIFDPHRSVEWKCWSRLMRAQDGRTTRLRCASARRAVRDDES